MKNNYFESNLIQYKNSIRNWGVLEESRLTTTKISNISSAYAGYFKEGECVPLFMGIKYEQSSGEEQQLLERNYR